MSPSAAVTSRNTLAVDVLPTTSVRALSGGKSALQNEVLGDLQNEFKNAR